MPSLLAVANEIFEWPRNFVLRQQARYVVSVVPIELLESGAMLKEISRLRIGHRVAGKSRDALARELRNLRKAVRRYQTTVQTIAKLTHRTPALGTTLQNTEQIHDLGRGIVNSRAQMRTSMRMVQEHLPKDIVGPHFPGYFYAHPALVIARL